MFHCNTSLGLTEEKSVVPGIAKRRTLGTFETSETQGL